MTGGRCHRRKKMTEGRAAEAEEEEEEMPSAVSRVPAKNPASAPVSSWGKGVDFYAQARKALCLRSPNDGSDEASLPAPTLPSGLAGFLSRQSDSRKRHKKSHPGPGNKQKKKSSAVVSSSKSKAHNVWVQNEEYFRDLTMLDIEKLSEVSELSYGLTASRKCFLIPVLSDVREEENMGIRGDGNDGVAVENRNPENKENGVHGEEEEPEEQGKPMEVDNVKDEEISSSERSPLVSEPPHGFEWLLGSRNKVYLTSERPSKKRKLLGGDAGLEKVLVSCPCEGASSTLCHFCSAGDLGKEFNPLISCSSCRVSVHRKCYGVQKDEVDSAWLCSWCKHKGSDSSTCSENPCVLCPKKAGALKPISQTVEKDKDIEFVHLFCSQWAPEVYIEDLEKMEPVMNVEAVKEVRKKMVCSLCKVKCGACVRCSHGTCRASFHPLCAREAKHRMEIWGKYGSDDVELRAFCLKHSEIVDNNNTTQAGDTTLVAGSNSDCIDNLPEKNVGCRNGDDSEVHTEALDTISEKLFETDSRGTGLSCPELKDMIVPEGNLLQSSNNVKESEKSNEDVIDIDTSNFPLILKKLVDRGRINMGDVAAQMGISLDSLSASLAGDPIGPDLQRKIAKWLSNNVHLNALPKYSRIKTRSKVLCKAEFGAIDDSNDLSVPESDNTDHVAVKSVPPRRRTKSNNKNFNDPKVLGSNEISSDKEAVVNEVKVDQFMIKETDKSNEVSIPDADEEKLTENVGAQQATTVPKNIGSPAGPPQETGQVEEASIPIQNNLMNSNGNPSASVADIDGRGVQKTEVGAVPRFYIHPEIENKLHQMKDREHLCSSVMVLNNGSIDQEINTSGSNDQKKHSECGGMGSKDDLAHSEQLVKAMETGVLERAPLDEVEGEIIYFQHRLLSNAASRRPITERLISSVSKGLPQEIDLSRSRGWDAVVVNKYLCGLKEAKKQGRKERKHKEAQAVLAAATAAAAASSRISSVRKDGDEATNLENTTTGRYGSSSQSIPRAKETLQRVGAPRISLDKHSDSTQSVVDFSKEHLRSCDICRRSETLLNPILVCCSCKVAVHLDCYHSVKESTGPWYCELCEEVSSSRSNGAPSVNFWEKPYFVAECALCGGSTGAFRKSSDGQWVHAFCAEWVLESKFRRGQVNSVEGMETLSKGVDLCQICHRKHGVCVKCNFGHCQAAFHPWCARSAGLYMNVKGSGAKQQHKAYCEKHSVDQRAKAETQKHGAEELKSLKQVRVELERLRLLCERLIKREKLKRELILCSHDILAMKRDHVARSALGRTPYPHPDISSESVTTSLRGQTEDYKSCSEAFQRSDDITVDSSVSIKRRSRMDDQRTEDDCSTSQNQFPRKPIERSQVSGKQIPHRPSSITTRNLMDDTWRSKSKKQETFEKEIVMTSDQATVKNMRLPKGYAYVPADCLSNEKQQNQDSGSGEPSDHGG